MAEQDRAYVWQLLDHSSDYGALVHTELMNLVRAPPRLVLDVGCGLAANGVFLKERFPSCRVMGVEPVDGMAVRAAKQLDHVFNCRFEDIDLSAAGVQPGEIDLVIFSDVLEHMYHPWKILQETKPMMSQDGVVVASIPNIRHIGVINELVKGDWNYHRYGILDITHIRFFTRLGVERLFSETGYRVDELIPRIDPNLQQLVDRIQDHTDRIDLEYCELRKLKKTDLIELLTLQFLVRASPITS
ncbi:MAG: class I SAM-dependent methyltransferase [Magnetococcales bacterium]|nr:class I SAM-dependent methyltransferase [Magnetococcales bacterium]